MLELIKEKYSATLDNRSTSSVGSDNRNTIHHSIMHKCGKLGKTNERPSKIAQLTVAIKYVWVQPSTHKVLKVQ